MNIKSIPNFVFAFLLLFASCVRYSPYEVIIDPEDSDSNRKNIEKLLVNGLTGDTITFVYVGDTQRFYEESDEMVHLINTLPEVEFVAISGDLTDFGLQYEFDEMKRILDQLNVPYLTAVGNHDLIYNGRLVYEKMFGPLDYSFYYKDMKFIFLNTNGREFGFNGEVPNITWLNQQLSDTVSYKNALVIEHVPPNNADFDPQLNEAYISTLATWGKTILSMNGHNHDFAVGEPYNDGVTYFNSFSAGKQKFSLIKVWESGFSYENIEF